MWQPIETAPKDGRYVLVAARDIYGDNDKGGAQVKPILSYWVGKDDPTECLRERWSCVGTHWRATHWMEIPDLPKQKAAR